jgi:HK97 family phage prohead protease
MRIVKTSDYDGSKVTAMIQRLRDLTRDMDRSVLATPLSDLIPKPQPAATPKAQVKPRAQAKPAAKGSVQRVAQAVPARPTIAVEALARRQAEDRQKLRDRLAGLESDACEELTIRQRDEISRAEAEYQNRLGTSPVNRLTAIRLDYAEALNELRQKHAQEKAQAEATAQDRRRDEFEKLAATHARELTGGGASVQIQQVEDLKTLSGYVTLFKELSLDLGGFREMIMPGAFSQTLEDVRNREHDILAYVEHDSRLLLGRMSAGNVRLAEDTRGLRFWIDPVDTNAGRDVSTLVRRGVIRGMSFGFTLGKEKWVGAKGSSIREVHSLKLWEVSAVSSPAYPKSSVGIMGKRSQTAQDEKAWWTSAYLKSLIAISSPVAAETANQRSRKGGYQWR